MLARLTTGGLAALVLATTLLACGGDSETADKAPRIPAGVAERLALLSDETAAALEAGDECSAQEIADELESEALKAEAQIPAELRGQVREGVQRLSAPISCEPVVETVTETSPEDTESACSLLERLKEDEGDGPGKSEEAPGQLSQEEEQQAGDLEKEAEARLKDLEKDLEDRCKDEEGGDGEGSSQEGED